MTPHAEKSFMPETAAPAKGTRPEGAHTEADASRQVREMFTQIAPRYDLLNHVLSMQLDRVWRARVARRLRAVLERPDALVLDLCCGTGDLAFSLARPNGARIVGADFSHAMLVRADEKARTLAAASTGGTTSIPFFEADALNLPFAGESFDLVTTAFGFRNLANYESGLREIARILRPGGTLAILEFTEPPDSVMGNLYRWYCGKILPRIGGMISGNALAYVYLPRSISRFFKPSELAVLMKQMGYSEASYETWMFGSVALHTARKS
jgi:demethylmenaquinone methyltransferase/2-methoxy-6-polyprenyl-1,4-benzoquinol methylase